MKYQKRNLSTVLLPALFASSVSYSVGVTGAIAADTSQKANQSKQISQSIRQNRAQRAPRYDDEGYDRRGYDAEGYDREGYNRRGYDEEGYDREGYNRKGYDRDGYDQDGYNQSGYDREGYDRDGYNQLGYDREGYDRDGYNAAGYDRKGNDREGNPRGKHPSNDFYQANYLIEQPLERQFNKDPSRDPLTNSLPSPRAISNAVSAQTEGTQNHKNLSDMFWLWGQFLDHDIDLSLSDESKPAFISIPADDPIFAGEMPFSRSISNAAGEQLNDITPFIDGSNIYASSAATERSLRTGQGGLFILVDNLLPTEAHSGLYISGDIRVNENIALTAMHTIWVREHNRIAKQLARKYRDWNDDQLFNAARKIVVAEMQAITFNEFLPLLLGKNAIASYQGYDENVSPQIINSFSTAAYRFGHTMLSSELLRLNKRYRPIAAGHVPLKQAFFNPALIKQHGVDSLLRGLSAQTAQAFDPLLVDDIRNFLFANTEGRGFDLASLNIQRGRDHLLPSYNAVRIALGLAPINQFQNNNFSAENATKLASIYPTTNDMDLWVAGLAEKPEGDSLLGAVFSRIIKQQFENIRDGDTSWYENGQFTAKELKQLKRLKLSQVIKRNTGIKRLSHNVLIARSLPRARGTAESNQVDDKVQLQNQPQNTQRNLSPALREAIRKARSQSNNAK